MKRLILLVVILTLTLSGQASAISQGELLSGINSVRANNGKPALVINAKLNASAQAKAADMCANNYWAHGNWVPFIEAQGYSYQQVGENLAYGFQTTSAAVQAWVNSPGHFANIVGNFSETGFGWVECASFQNSGKQIIIANHFGRPTHQVKAAPVAPQPVQKTEPAPKPQPVEAVEPQPEPAPTLYDLLKSTLERRPYCAPVKIPYKPVCGFWLDYFSLGCYMPERTSVFHNKLDLFLLNRHN